MAKGDISGAIVAFKIDYHHNPLENHVAYYLAAAYSMDRQIDSAYKYLFKSIEIDSTVRACSDPFFLPLRNDSRWQVFENRAIDLVRLVLKADTMKDYPLARKLWYMSALDQAYYYEIDLLDSALGVNSPAAKALWDIKAQINEQNARAIDSIYAIKGWPTYTQVGFYASQGAFLIIQHSSVERMEKYIGIIKELCETGEGSCEDYVFMYDRIEAYHGRPQLYGSQVIFNETTGKNELYPVLDEKNVDVRRNGMGLEPLDMYLLNFDIRYVPPK